MNNYNFQKILADRIQKIHDTIASKSNEYASDEDRLHNFKAAALIERCSPKEALLGMWTKHLVSVIDIIKSKTLPPEKVIDEKIGDAINYLFLLEILLIEEQNKEMDKNK